MNSCAVNKLREAVNCGALCSPPAGFTSFLLMNVVENSLSSTETISKLVEKSVQIFI
jgi:hypothetical protein